MVEEHLSNMLHYPCMLCLAFIGKTKEHSPYNCNSKTLGSEGEKQDHTQNKEGIDNFS